MTFAEAIQHLKEYSERTRDLYFDRRNFLTSHDSTQNDENGTISNRYRSMDSIECPTQ